MKQTMIFLLLVFMMFAMTACTSQMALTNLATDNPVPAIMNSTTNESALLVDDKDMISVNITVGNKTFVASFYDTMVTQNFLAQMPLTIDMADLNGNEKYYTFANNMPASTTETPATIQIGEIMCYSSNTLVLFYKTFSNAYGGYSRLGYVNDTSGLEDALGSGKTTVTFSLAKSLEKSTESKVLVAYFSATETTEKISKWIAEQTSADLYEIIPENPYTSADLNYGNSSSRATMEHNDPSVRPVISGAVENMEKYDTVFLGYPIWHGQAPKIISTFLESYNFVDKTIVPFCTSHSSDSGSSDTNLHSLCPDSTTWLLGQRFSAESSKEMVKEWIKNLNISTEKSVRKFNFETKTVLLNSGYEMPIMGLGTYSLPGEVCFKSVMTLLDAGGRLIDTAHIYGNEESVGQAVQASSIPREEIFVITKLYPNQFGNAKEAIEESLRKLDIGYIDMMLLHHPGSGDVEAYKAMEKAVEEGKIRSIGLSNWYIKELTKFLPQITIMPALVQNEIHPYYQDNDVIPFIQEKGIVVQGWYPLGGRDHTKEILKNETISAIAQAHGVSSAQVILRWNLQKGVVVIPGSSNPDHIKENLDIFGFALTNDEMAQITALDRNEKHDWY